MISVEYTDLIINICFVVVTRDEIFNIEKSFIYVDYTYTEMRECKNEKSVSSMHCPNGVGLNYIFGMNF